MVMLSMCRGTRRWFSGIWRSAFRVKSPRYHVLGEDAEDATYSSVWELVNVALPSSLLIGILVVGGQVGGYITGPAVVLSALIAGASVTLTAPCYAEYRARWPRVAGSPYEYTYLSIGEGVAFLLGVIHFLQVVTMAATGGRAASQSLDLMLNNRILNKTRQHLGAIDAFHSTPDLIGGAFVLIVTVAVATGVQRHQQKVVTFFANSISILLILFCAIVGLFHMRFDLWHSPKDFFPRGYAGVIEGAATFIYALSSFEVITSKCDFSRQTAGRVSTLAFVLTASSSVLLYMLLPALLTLLAPISHLTTEAPIAESFSHAGVVWMKYIICVPIIVLLFIYMWLVLWRCQNLLETVSLDALICSQFSYISDRTNTALLSAIFSGAIAALLAVLFSLTNLIQLASLCCLLVSIVTCAAAVCIRYRPSILVHSPTHTTRKDRVERRKHRKQKQNPNSEDFSATSSAAGGGYGSVTTNNNTSDCPMLTLESDDEEEQFVGTEINGDLDKLQFNTASNTNNDSDTDIDEAVEEYKETLRIAAFASCTFGTNSDTPTEVSARRAAWTITAFIIWLFCLSAVLTHGAQAIKSGNILVIIFLVVFLILCILTLVILLQYPQDPVSVHDLRMSFPLSPWLPLVAIIVNIHLVLHLGNLAWIQASLIIITGGALYLGYGMKNSRASHFYEFLPEEETILLPEPPIHQVEPRFVSRPVPNTESNGGPRQPSNGVVSDNIEALLTD